MTRGATTHERSGPTTDSVRLPLAGRGSAVPLLPGVSLPADLRVALVHDWLTGMRGGEKVLEALCALFPGAEIFTLVHVPGSVSPAIERHRVHASFVSSLPFVKRLYRHFLPVFPLAVELFNLESFDFVLSVSHCVAKSAVKGKQARHLCYCLTPMRYAWDQFDAYFGPARLGHPSSALMKPVIGALARWDAATAGRPDRYLAISQYVASRVRRYYNRQAGVIYPPVDTGFFTPDASAPDGSALVVSALVPYKRVELAIAACRQAGVLVRIVGQGPEMARLRQAGGPGVEFLGTLPDDEVRASYRRASVVVLPGEEDFGIVPLEAQACGRPVVALGRGGALETVVDGVTGVLVAEPSVDAFAHAIAGVVRAPHDTLAIRRHAEAFGPGRFAAEMAAAVREVLERPADLLPW